MLIFPIRCCELRIWGLSGRFELAKRRAFFIGLLLGSACFQSYAQDAGSLLREQQRQQDLQRLERLPQPEESRRPQAPVIRPEKGESIVVRDLRFTGKVGLLPEAKRASLIAAVKGKRLGIAGIKAIADEATLAIQARGRMLGYAVLPPQDITEGVVTIRILEGRLEKIQFERTSGVRIQEDLLSGSPPPACRTMVSRRKTWKTRCCA
jgi:hemolysin activation/secretion protein